MILQDGTMINKRLPVHPKWSDNENDFVSDIKEISAGQSYGFLMLKNDNTVWASVRATADTRPQYPIYVLNEVVKVQAAGQELSEGEPKHGMALKSDGTVWAWGDNAPSRSLLKAKGLSSVNSVSVSKNVSLTLISGHALALRSNGTVWAWGGNRYGQLGNGQSNFLVINPLQVLGLSDVIAVSAGNEHSLALKSDGTVWAWGRDNFGQLGDDLLVFDKSTPVQVSGLTNVIAISAGVRTLLPSNQTGLYGHGELTPMAG
jgi:alpha-tubulin suppressor-like RCC1 family protein